MSLLTVFGSSTSLPLAPLAPLAPLGIDAAGLVGTTALLALSVASVVMAWRYAAGQGSGPRNPAPPPGPAAAPPIRSVPGLPFLDLPPLPSLPSLQPLPSLRLHTLPSPVAPSSILRSSSPPAPCIAMSRTAATAPAAAVAPAAVGSVVPPAAARSTAADTDEPGNAAPSPVIFFTIEAQAPFLLRDAPPALAHVIGCSEDDLSGRGFGTLVDTAAWPHVTGCLEAGRLPDTGAIDLQLVDRTGGRSWWRLHVDPAWNRGDRLMRACLVDLGALKQSQRQADAQTLQTGAAQARVEWMSDMLDETRRTGEVLQQASDLVEGCRHVATAGERLFPGWSGALVCDGPGRPRLLAGWRGGAGDAGSAADAVADTAGTAGTGDAAAAAGSRMHPRVHRIRVPLRKPTSGGSPAAGAGPLPGAISAGAVTLQLDSSLRHSLRPLHDLRRDAGLFAGIVALQLAGLELKLSLQQQAVHDGLTGLYNRRHFDASLTCECDRAERTADVLTLAVLDIDHFKLFNDLFGHQAGDAVLQAVAAQLVFGTRPYDIACRVGGEEMALLLPGVTLDEAVVRLNQLRERIAALQLVYDGRSLPPVTVSIGVAQAGTRCGECELELLRHADRALYAAKHGGRNRLERWIEGSPLQPAPERRETAAME